MNTPHLSIERAGTRFCFGVFDEWPSERERDGVIRAAFRYCGIDCNVVTHTKRNASHARLLEIKTGDGQRCTLWLDQGFSFWQIPRGGLEFSERKVADFCFMDDFDSQARCVCGLHARISGQNFPTYIFADRG